MHLKKILKKVCFIKVMGIFVRKRKKEHNLHSSKYSFYNVSFQVFVSDFILKGKRLSSQLKQLSVITVPIKEDVN